MKSDKSGQKQAPSGDAAKLELLLDIMDVSDDDAVLHEGEESEDVESVPDRFCRRDSLEITLIRMLKKGKMKDKDKLKVGENWTLAPLEDDRKPAARDSNPGPIHGILKHAHHEPAHQDQSQHKSETPPGQIAAAAIESPSSPPRSMKVSSKPAAVTAGEKKLKQVVFTAKSA